MKNEYRFYNDPGHGWLRVARRELLTLGIADRITVYSYQSRKGAWVYLEEDQDWTTFDQAKKARGEAYTTLDYYHEDNRVRGLANYSNGGQ